MRIPFRNLYRAFPELDEFTDEECQTFMGRDRLYSWALLLRDVLTFAVGLPVIALGAMAVAHIPWLQNVMEGLNQSLPGWGPLATVILLLVPVCLVILYIRDWVLRPIMIEAIRRHLDRLRCPHCRHILMGQRPHGDWLTCPECGQRTAMPTLGITAADLIPPLTRENELGHD